MQATFRTQFTVHRGSLSSTSRWLGREPSEIDYPEAGLGVRDRTCCTRYCPLSTARMRCQSLEIPCSWCLTWSHRVAAGRREYCAVLYRFFCQLHLLYCYSSISTVPYSSGMVMNLKGCTVRNFDREHVNASHRPVLSVHDLKMVRRCCWVLPAT